MHDWQRLVRDHLPPLGVGPARENEIVAELALQLEQAYTDAVAGGAGDEVALRRALAQFPDWQGLAGDIRTVEPRTGSDAILGGVWQDLRYAARFLRRSPAFAAIAILTLAFGIGGNTAIFTMVDAIALRSLPYPESSRLVAIETRKTQQPEVEPWASILDFFDLRERAQSFSAVAGISPVWSVVMTGQGDSERLECLYVSASFFPMLGIKPSLGRTFLPSEDNRSAASPLVLLSDAFWKRRFAADPNIVGKALNLDGGSYTVIGVLPPGFRYRGEPLAGSAAEIDAWFPLASNQLASSVRNVRFLKVIGRLNPGVSTPQAQDEVRRIGQALAEQYPATNLGFVVDAQALQQQVTGRFRKAMLLLVGAVGFVLLMACASVANLLLARASARSREISIRCALGASRFRLLRQMLTEGFVLAAAGGVAGLLLAKIGLRMLIAAAPVALRLGDATLDARALAFTSGAVLLCTFLASLPPAWRMVRADIESALREGGRNLTTGQHRLRSALVVVQVAAALLLLVGAALLIRSFQQLLSVDPGFQTANLVTITTQVPASLRSPAVRAGFYRTIHDQLIGMPGVQSAAAVSRLPLMGANLGAWLYPEGKFAPGQPGHDVEYRVATPNYFATMGIPLRAGRFFDEHDDANPGSVVLINQTAAHKFWPGEDPVGKRIKLGSPPEGFPWITVVGVVGDIHHVGLDSDPRPEVYRPYALNPLFNPILVIRTSADPGPMLTALAARVRSASGGAPAYNVFLMQSLVDRSAAERRFLMLLLSGFAMAALVLAVVGVYGLVSQAVTGRTQEIGLRMALGASPFSAVWLVFHEGMRLSLAGIVAGAVGAVAMARMMGTLLFQVPALDPLAFAAAALALAAFAALACYVPARRATRVDPVTALRSDS